MMVELHDNLVTVAIVFGLLSFLLVAIGLRLIVKSGSTFLPLFTLLSRRDRSSYNRKRLARFFGCTYLLLAIMLPWFYVGAALEIEWLVLTVLIVSLVLYISAIVFGYTNRWFKLPRAIVKSE